MVANTPSILHYTMFSFSKYIDFIIYLDILYIKIHNKNYISRKKVKISYDLELRE